MARSTQRMPKAQRRAQVLETATDEFVAHGFRSTSMEEIAHAIGVTKPVLYQHFASKEQLYLAVVEGVGRRVLAAARSLPPLTGERIDRARRSIERVRQLSAEELGVQLLLSPEFVSEEVSVLVADYRTQLALEIARSIVHRRAVPDETAVALGRCLIALAGDDVLRPRASLDRDSHDPPGESGRLEVISRLVASGIFAFGDEAAAHRLTLRPSI